MPWSCSFRVPQREGVKARHCCPFHDLETWKTRAWIERAADSSEQWIKFSYSPLFLRICSNMRSFPKLRNRSWGQVLSEHSGDFHFPLALSAILQKQTLISFSRVICKMAQQHSKVLMNKVNDMTLYPEGSCLFQQRHRNYMKLLSWQLMLAAASLKITISASLLFALNHF